MSSLLFNVPHWVVVILALAGIAVTWAAVRQQNDRLRNFGFGILLAAVILLVLRLTIETDEKRVEKQARGLMEAISKDDWNTAGGYLKYARMYEWSGDEVTEAGKYAAHHWGLTELTVNSLTMKRELDVFTVTLSITTAHKDQYFSSVPSVWSMEYGRRSKEWVLTHLVPLKIGPNDIVNPEEIIRANRGSYRP